MQLDQARAVQMGGGERRRQLIDATVMAIAEHGLSGLTLAKVAVRAGLTAASVNFHFTSKDALLQETLRHLADEFDGAVRGAVQGAVQGAAAGVGEDAGEDA